MNTPLESAMLGEMQAAMDLRPLAQLLRVSPESLHRKEEELRQPGPFSSHLAACIQRGVPFMGGMLDSFVPYLVCRVLEPEIVIETGVANGFSSFYILYALHRNDRGRLISIDQPGHEAYLMQHEPSYRRKSKTVSNIPEGQQTGWVVPDDLRARWDVRLGLSDRLMESALSEVRTVGVFLHDSAHTYRCTMMELKAVWPHLIPGGVAIVDDIHWSQAFGHFAALVGQRGLIIGRTGLVKKGDAG